MLIAHECGIVVLWDVEAMEQVSIFERQPLGFMRLCGSIGHLDGTATINSTTAVAKV